MSSHFSYHSNRHLSIKNWKQEKWVKGRKALGRDQHSDREIVIFDQLTSSTSSHGNTWKILKNQPGEEKVLEGKQSLSG